MTSSARIAVVGTGWWATASHIPALQASEHVSGIVLCDSDPGKLRAAGEAFGLARRYTDLQGMLERVRAEAAARDDDRIDSTSPFGAVGFAFDQGI